MTWIDSTPAGAGTAPGKGQYLPNDDGYPTVTWLTDPIYTHVASAAGGMANVYWPCIIHPKSCGITSPLDEYYMYMSTDHGSGGVRLWSGPSPVGPWTFQGLVFDAGGSTETPSVVYDPVLKRLNMYYQKIFGLQETGLAVSTNGIAWTDQGKVMPSGGTGGGTGHTGYQTIWRQGGLWWAEGLGRAGSNSMMSRRWSLDGINWTRDVRGVCRGNDQAPAGKKLGFRKPFYWKGRPFYVCTVADLASSGGSASGSDFLLSAASSDFRNNAGIPTIYGKQAWQSDNGRATAVFTDPNGKAYVYWQTGNQIAAGVLS